MLLGDEDETVAAAMGPAEMNDKPVDDTTGATAEEDDMNDGAAAAAGDEEEKLDGDGRHHRALLTRAAHTRTPNIAYIAHSPTSLVSQCAVCHRRSVLWVGAGWDGCGRALT